MEVLPAAISNCSACLPRRCGEKLFEPNTEAIKQRLLRKGVDPTPKILHTLRKKEIQKHIRRSKKQAKREEAHTLTESQKNLLEEEALFRSAAAEYRALRAELGWKSQPAPALVGSPWKKLSGAYMAGLGSESKVLTGQKLKAEHLEELRMLLAERNEEAMKCFLDDDDVEKIGVGEQIRIRRSPSIERMTDDEKIKLLTRRFVYTKLLSVLGKERRPLEALKIFSEMREDGLIYPDMAAYHSISVTLGQAGLVEKLIHIIECMRQKPSKNLKKSRDWDPCLDPDIIVFHAVLNACVPSRQWKGVPWVLQQMRLSGLRPTETTYGLAMEVMLKAGKYDFVHNFFEKMQQSRLAPKAISYKVLVKTFWEEGKVNEAIAVVRDMERRGVVGISSVYYELACCLCNNGRWLDAIVELLADVDQTSSTSLSKSTGYDALLARGEEVEKLKKLTRTKPLEVTFTGMILASLDGGYANDSIAIFYYMKDHCTPNIGTINAMLKVYGCCDMFVKAKELFESIKEGSSGSSTSDEVQPLKPDSYTYTLMLESSASAHQWEFFEYVYKEMALSTLELDMNKYSWLLVEAAKAGKWHLLEHAFDQILESGEIPHLSLFTEMLCQMILQQNFERIISLLNGLAHASLQISESQWMRLFDSNKARFSMDALQNLLNHLKTSSELLMEKPIPDLFRSLEHLCKMKPEEHAFSHDSTANYLNCQHVIPPQIREYCENRSDDSLHLQEHLSFNSKMYNEARECASVEDGNSLVEGIDSVLDQLTGDVGEASSRLPSASDILQLWKEERTKNCNFTF
ncbi:Pentatricopeptide repeat-containing protein [Apostasia shenzhenica]|uniref:Pentatricopeptide repeat-containing protein n=1 Tax=Apostasia shenzhenica TaxID=1088818 RepID=A0A2I0ARK0_9ASPA|nr:Pentatricopeptide repeat-containing protein [Apostasia shenzhenica]